MPDKIVDMPLLSPVPVCAGYYSVDAKAETAIDGEWRKGPGKELFDALEKVHSHKAVVIAHLLSA